MKNYLQALSDGHSLERDEMRGAVKELLLDETSESQIAGFLTLLKMKGETVDEITALVEVLRENAMPIESTLKGVMDNCGTGGDGSHSFNISTTCAFVLAGAGVKVAKHGNRSISSKTGSADVLENLGVCLDFQAHDVESLLNETNIAFLYAPHIHTGLKKIMKVRKELKIPTIFNLIGPLTNPVQLETQLVGVYRRDKLEMMANVLHELGRKRAIVLNGADYMDEASLAGENHLVLLENGITTPFTISGEEVGLPAYSLEEIRGGDARDNARILRDVLEGKEGACTDTVLFNSGIALFAHGKAPTIAEGVKLARESIKSGRANEKLQALVHYSQQRRKQVI
ncbi:anthranilate phosphoribosyltransferase [Rossellomorea vietnamensis]|uniref:Anthranilate phosphoribosyltransferase n=1 Tax=Rossellomorea vietnamensis TaxID=218284 RepID=A0A0P6VYE4_9BACI|nr:anthranilate phosphoribosyltransferase [Rossellomorea vietnamensis]KPL57905.1 anthranilate phosphoribosyltransferase [Rossellomorea vietnamensis]